MHKGLEITRAMPGDAVAVSKLMTTFEPWITLGATEQQSLATFSDPQYLVFVARLDNELAGAVIVHPRGLASSPYIKSIAVDQPFRSRGIGRELIAFVENYFRNDFNHLFLCVSSFNKRAQDFYLNLGFKQAGVLEEYIIKGESELLMSKRIR